MEISSRKLVPASPRCRFLTLLRSAGRNKTSKANQHCNLKFSAYFLFQILSFLFCKQYFTYRPLLAFVEKFPLDFDPIFFSTNAHTPSEALNTNTRPASARPRTTFITR